MVKRQKRNLSYIWLFPLIILVFFLVFSTIKVEERKRNLSREISSLQKELSALKKENNLLKETEREGKSSYYIEKVLREKGLYKKKGEKVVVILGKPPKIYQKQPEVRESFLERVLKKLKLRQ